MSTYLPKVEKFEHIECESITVTNGEGAKIRLDFNAAGQPEVSISGVGTDPDANQLTLTVNHNGGIIAVSGLDGDARIGLSIDDRGRGQVLTLGTS